MESINNKIIRELFEEGWLEKHCRAACPNNKALTDDLMQEIALVILEFKDKSLLKHWMSSLDSEDNFADVKVEQDALEQKINLPAS